MTGIELALQQLALKVAKNGFEKIRKNIKPLDAPFGVVGKAVNLIDDLDVFEIGDGVKNFVKVRLEQERIEKLNKETLEVNEAFFKKTVSRSLSVADRNKKPPYKKGTKKKGKK